MMWDCRSEEQTALKDCISVAHWQQAGSVLSMEHSWVSVVAPRCLVMATRMKKSIPFCVWLHEHMKHLPKL